MSEGHKQGHARLKERRYREHRLREAEKDLAFALVALHEGHAGKALLNVAVATIRISGVMTDAEFDPVFDEVRALKERG